VRGTALIVAILAVIACGLGSARAEAMPTSPGQAAASPPPAGEHCVTVHSNVHHWAGTVCVYVTHQSTKNGGAVAFSTHSGKLANVSVKILRVSWHGGGAPIVILKNASGPVSTGSPAILTRNWWDEPFGAVASAQEACMTWEGGDKACTGPGWVSSYPG
jgi:hypothetical protein